MLVSESSINQNSERKRVFYVYTWGTQPRDTSISEQVVCGVGREALLANCRCTCGETRNIAAVIGILGELLTLA